MFGGIVDSRVGFQGVDSFTGEQGDGDMILTPLGNRGNYFGRQNRYAHRTEWLESFSLMPLPLAGTHLLKICTPMRRSGGSRPVEGPPAQTPGLRGNISGATRFTTTEPLRPPAQPTH